MTKAESNRRGAGGLLRVLLVSVWLAVVGCAGLLAGSLGAALWGRLGGAGAALALLVLPLSFCMGIERVAQAWQKQLRAERLLLPAMFVFASALLAVAVFALPDAVGKTLRAQDDAGWFADQSRSVGRWWRRFATAPVETETTPPRDGPTIEFEATTRTTVTTTLTTSFVAPPAVPEPARDALPSDRSVGDESYREGGDCGTLADVSALKQGYDPRAFRASAEALAKLRYPLGSAFLEAQDDATLRVWFAQGTDSFDAMVSGLEAAVHEGSHLWGAKRLNGRTATYRVAPDVDVELRWLRNFDRSEILALHRDRERDTYADTYLRGASGAQGFNTLLDEYNAYAHSLAVRWCTRDLLPQNQRVSARDGILTMMYYVELYLSLARSAHPADYAAILADPGHRRLVTLVWDRAEYLLRKTAALPGLGLNDERIQAWVYAPELVAEIQRVRDVGAATPR